MWCIGIFFYDVRNDSKSRHGRFFAGFRSGGPIHEKAIFDYLKADRIGHLQERGLLAVALAASFLHDDAGGRVWRGRWLRDLVVAWGSVRECF